ncbi:hypothetical protein, variant [Puccinia striiformis f. sp. tritici PST-78]|uniref:Uncharacterized protein n=1 Tax=Puccinia striiformis f. sp. tritici PST-78 TaxID=1165861 RepID=A0A0L0VCV5_9BASI|nr:hypothetical protein PSTG_09545 [Puccinia striiformis f. sp. tritici PST-78]KNE97119.1 hypothetical protein, variant [Puccinia striiformis f. sp. tritici PST-78]
MSYSTKRSTIPFANTTPPEQQQSHHHHQQRPSSDSSSSSQPSPTKKTKKKQSILRKLSTSSRRSLSWLPGIQDIQSVDNNHKNAILTPPNSDQSTTRNKNNNLIGKGIIRNVARTVKKSLHSFDRPRLATAEPQQRLPASQQDRQQEEAIQPPSPQSVRARAVTISEASTPNKSKEHYTRSLNQPPYQSFDPDQVIEGPSTPPRSPKRLKKKTRPQSAFIEHPSPITQAVENVAPVRMSWHAQNPIGSLPMAATLLSQPSPPPIEDASFMAILPSQDKLNLPVPHHLSLIPPPSSLYVDPPTLTAISTGVEPALSRRVSISSSSSSESVSDHNNGFTFISTPSKFDSVPASPNPALGSSWMEIPAHPQHESYSEVHTSRPPIVTTATSISIVHSCVAERGSIAHLDLHLHADEQVEELAGTEIHNEFSRKRKVTSFINDSNPSKKETSECEVERDAESDRDCGPEERQHKVLRGLDQPFSSHQPPQSEPLSTLLTTPLTNLIRPRKLSSTKKNRKLSSKRSPNHHHEVHHHHVHHHTPSKNPRHSSSSSTEVWNLSVVSTVVGVVILAVVFIGSTNLSHLHNGKPSSSWIGNWIKKIV